MKSKAHKPERGARKKMNAIATAQAKGRKTSRPSKSIKAKSAEDRRFDEIVDEILHEHRDVLKRLADR